MPGYRSLKSRADFLLTRAPALYAAALRYRPAADADKIAFLELVRPGDVVFDVGANLGTYTVLFSHLVGARGEVHAFEPVPDTFTRLAATVAREARFDNVHANALAVSNEPKDVVLFLPGTDHGQASLARHSAGSWAGAPEVREYPCRATTLDAYADQRALGRVDFVKCDAEGATLPVLEGAVRLLARHRPVLHLELNPDWSRAFGYGHSDVAAFLGRAGYADIRAVGDGRDRPLPLEALGGLEGSVNVVCRPAGQRGR